MPFPTSSSPVGSPARAPRPARWVAVALLAAVALAACAATLGPAAGLAALLVASLALLVAAVLGVRAHWTAELRTDTAAVSLASPLESVPGDLLGLQLRGLQERAAADVSRALEGGREDLARELSDAYADDALRAITAAGLPPAAPIV